MRTPGTRIKGASKSSCLAKNSLHDCLCHLRMPHDRLHRIPDKLGCKKLHDDMMTFGKSISCAHTCPGRNLERKNWGPVQTCHCNIGTSMDSLYTASGPGKDSLDWGNVPNCPVEKMPLGHFFSPGQKHVCPGAIFLPRFGIARKLKCPRSGDRQTRGQCRCFQVGPRIMGEVSLHS